MSIDYLNIILPKYIDDTKSLYNLLFICKSLYNRSSKIVERIEKRYKLEPYARAKVFTIDLTKEEKEKIHDKYNWEYVCKKLENEAESDNYIMSYIFDNYSHLLKKEDIKKGNVIKIPNYHKVGLTFWYGTVDKYIFYDGDKFVYLFYFVMEVRGLDMNKNISVDEYNVSYFSDIFEHHWLHIDLNPYKDELLKNLIIHDDNNFAESYWKNGTIIYYLEEEDKVNKKITYENVKKEILSFCDNEDEKDMIHNMCQNMPEYKQYIKYLTYKKDNIISFPMFFVDDE